MKTIPDKNALWHGPYESYRAAVAGACDALGAWAADDSLFYTKNVEGRWYWTPAIDEEK